MSFAAGIGIINIDLTFAGLPRIPNEGEEIYAEDFSMQLGGGSVMTLSLLSRLGLPVKAATFLGKDFFSGFARREIRKAGIRPLNLYKEGRGTPLVISVAALTPKDRTFISYLDRQPVSGGDQEKMYRFFRGAKIAQLHPGYPDLFRRLKKDGTILIFDTGWDDELSLEKYDEYLKLADYYTPNRKEALKITGASTPEEAARRLGDYFDTVIIKLDREGCLIRDRGEFFTLPVIPEFSPVDSTGAGDAFLTGLMYGLFHDKPIKESVLMGNITGGKCVSARGCFGAWLEKKEFLSIVEKYRHYLI
jgi:sugar/nucleoside kinase (ribokinase family)